ncbi:MAG: hypothetical protein KTR35_05020 [Gammaproteobacteria bacterium]|nr:hypothetical protein [Gammaproteobacteria bacterium]
MLQNTEHKTQHRSGQSSTSVISDLKPVMEGLFPAFRDTKTGEVHLSLDQDGKLAQDHSFYNLPNHWISDVDGLGDAVTLIPTVVAGYWRSTGFIAIAKQIYLPLDS